jgi:hypothetical protein
LIDQRQPILDPVSERRPKTRQQRPHTERRFVLAASANSDSGSRAASRKPLSSWWRARRCAGSTVGPIKAIRPARAGESTANLVTT